MSPTLLGADAGELERAAAELRAAADHLDDQAGALTVSLRAVAWVGGVATEFASHWNSTHRPQIGSTARHLRDAAVRLDENAADQRRASGEATPGGSTSGSWSVVPADQSDRLADLDDVLAGLGLGRAEIKVVVAAAEGLAASGAAGPVIDLLTDDRFREVVAAAGRVLDVGNFVVDLVTDLGEHADLPLDERIVHGLTDAAVRFGLKEGIEHGAEFLAASLAASLLPGFGAILAPVVGEAAGAITQIVVGAAVERLDDGTDFVDWSADRAVEVWQDIKATFGVIVDVVETGAAIVTGAADLAGDAAEWLGEQAVDAVGGVVDDVGGAIGSAVGWLS